jgi:putative transposase
MRRSYYELYIHAIWTTKKKVSMIKGTLETSIYDLVKVKCNKFNVKLIAGGNTEDHIHLLLSINPNIKIAEVIGEIKGSTSYFINHKTQETLYWQDGFGVLSVSKSGVANVKQYVENQKEHHRKKVSLVPALEKSDEDCGV